MSFRRSITVVVLALLVVAGGLGAAGYLITHETDFGKVWYKRWKAPSPYTFDEIPPGLMQTDAASLIADLDSTSVGPLRLRVNAALWGSPTLPVRLPETIDRNFDYAELAGLGGLDRIDRLTVPFEYKYTAHAYLLYPKKPNGRAVVYHHGYAGTLGQARPILTALLKKGYLVAAFNYAGYGQNSIGTIDHPKFGRVSAENDRQMYYVKNPLRWYLEPMVVAINHLYSEGYTDIAAIGFSAGGWVTTMVGAVDERVKTTIAVASGYPLYIRAANWDYESPLPQFYKPLLDTASYLDAYVLASLGSGRQYIQIFNQYDRCCYRNRFSELYAPAVSETVQRLGDGRFTALIDQSHADHKVSSWAVSEILTALRQ